MKNSEHKKLAAIITEEPTHENGYYYVVETTCGKVMRLRGFGAPMEGKVGEKGTVQYQTGAGFGLYFWDKE